MKGRGAIGAPYCPQASISAGRRAIGQEHFNGKPGINAVESSLFPGVHRHPGWGPVFEVSRVARYALAVPAQIPAVLRYENDSEAFQASDLGFDSFERRHELTASPERSRERHR